MKTIIWARELARKVLTSKNPLFAFSVKEQKEYISRFKEPTDDIERSFFQYKCQMKLSGGVYKSCVSIISGLILFPLIIKFYYNNYRTKKNTETGQNKSQVACYFDNDLGFEYLADELKTEFETIIIAELTGDKTLDMDAFKFMCQIIRRYPLSSFFLLKILLKIASYNAEIIKNHPKAIIASAEYSFTSSACTEYCNRLGIEHINIMHGEKLFFMMDAFFHFNRCYVFDEYYIEMFEELRATGNHFIVSLPSVFNNLKTQIDNSNNNIKYEKKYYKYYLAAETEEELIKIAASLKELQKKHINVCVRAHPIYGDYNILSRIFDDGIKIENPKDITIAESLSNCQIAISLRSFVLQQAYYCGIDTVVDDITDPKHFNSLAEMGYIMIQKSRRMTEIINN